MLEKFEAIIDVTLDGKGYKKGDTFEARAELREHFESNGIGKMQTGKEKEAAKTVKK